jgi:hypothetical protein
LTEGNSSPEDLASVIIPCYNEEESVHVHMHNGYLGEGIESGLSAEALKRLEDLLNYLEKNQRGEVWSTTFHHVYEHWYRTSRSMDNSTLS